MNRRRDYCCAALRSGYLLRCRARQSTSSALQTSSPKPSTNTSSQPSAADARGADCSERLAPWSTTAAAALLLPLETLLTPERPAARPPASTGTPTETPETVMLLEPGTAVAPIVRLPATMPASPALTTPRGAYRSTSPGLRPAVVASVWMPLPVSAAGKFTTGCPFSSNVMVG